MIKKIFLIAAILFIAAKSFSQCNNVTSGGTIEGDENSASSFNPQTITNLVLPSGGSGTLQYQWQSSTNLTSWYNLSGATLGSYDPYTISNTTYYRRTARRSGCTAYDGISNTVMKLVISSCIQPGSTAYACTGSFVTLSVPAVAGFTYQWKKGAQYLVGATQNTYNANQTAVYSCYVFNGSAYVNTNGCSVTLQLPLTTTITNAGFTGYCSITPFDLQATATPAGNNYSYQWLETNSAVVRGTNAAFAAPHNGNYLCKAINACGAFPSSVYLVNSPQLTLQPIGTIFPVVDTIKLCSGGSITFTVTDPEDMNGFVDWYKDGQQISAYQNFYTVTTPGTYYCITNDYCFTPVYSNSVVVVSGTNPAPTVSIAGPTVLCYWSSPVMLTATSTGNPCSYQWKLGGNIIYGANSRYYFASSTGAYTCVASNGCGTAASNTLSVTNSNNSFNSYVTIPIPAFCSGSSVTLNAPVGTNYTYQWMINSHPIPGATNAAYTSSIEGAYKCWINNNTCSGISGPFEITEQDGPPVTYNYNLPNPFYLCTGSSTSSSVYVTSESPYTLQWMKNGVDIPGATQTYYTINSAGSYYCRVTNACGFSFGDTLNVISNSVLPTVSISSPTTVLCSGASILLTGTATSATSYLWKKNNTNIYSATQATYSANAAGSYTLTVTNSCGSTISNAIVLTTVAPLSETINAGGVATFCPGGSVVLTAGTTSGYTYQWKSGVNIIAGATNTTYTATQSGTYTCAVADGCSNGTSNAISVTVISNPANAISCAYTTVCSGASTTLYATNNASYTYQWKMSGQNISGATHYSYTSTQAGTYVCDVSNQCITLTSNSITITVLSVPLTPGTITGNNHPCQNSSFVYSISAVANATSYNWVLPANATIASGQGTTSVTVNFSGTFASGNIQATAMNACGASSPNTKALYGSAPATPGAITGQKYGVCGLTTSYSIAPVSGATAYTWTVPAGVLINSGQGTASVSVNYPSSFTSGNVSVAASSSCGTSALKTIAVNGVPKTPGTISGPATVCANQAGVVFYIAPVFGATSYAWSAVGGGTIASGQGTTSITVNYGNNTSGVKVKAVNGCGISAMKSKAVSVTCKLEDEKIESDSIFIYPNPTQNNFHLKISSSEFQNYSIRIFGAAGVEIKKIELHESNDEIIFGDDLPSGIYFVHVTDADQTRVLKIVKTE